MYHKAAIILLLALISGQHVLSHRLYSIIIKNECSTRATVRCFADGRSFPRQRLKTGNSFGFTLRERHEHPTASCNLRCGDDKMVNNFDVIGGTAPSRSGFWKLRNDGIYRDGSIVTTW